MTNQITSGTPGPLLCSALILAPGDLCSHPSSLRHAQRECPGSQPPVLITTPQMSLPPGFWLLEPPSEILMDHPRAIQAFPGARVGSFHSRFSQAETVGVRRAGICSESTCVRTRSQGYEVWVCGRLGVWVQSMDVWARVCVLVCACVSVQITLDTSTWGVHINVPVLACTRVCPTIITHVPVCASAGVRPCACAHVCVCVGVLFVHVFFYV